MITTTPLATFDICVDDDNDLNEGEDPTIASFDTLADARQQEVGGAGAREKARYGPFDTLDGAKAAYVMLGTLPCG